MSDRKSLDLLQQKINMWLSKKGVVDTAKEPDKKKVKRTRSGKKTCENENSKAVTTKKSTVTTRRHAATTASGDVRKQTTLDHLLSPKENKRKPETRNTNSQSKNKYSFPSVEEILKEREEFEQYKAIVASFKPRELKLPSELHQLNSSSESEVPQLDCKHLSHTKIKEYFFTHREALVEIHEGKLYNSRHHAYMNKHKSSSSKSLTYNDTMILFVYDQIKIMADLLCEDFDQDGRCTDYIFQVMVPELCLRIFMDAYNKSREEAVEYLSGRPV